MPTTNPRTGMLWERDWVCTVHLAYVHVTLLTWPEMFQNSKQQIPFEFPCSFNIFVQVEALHLQIAIQIINVVQ